MLQHTGPQNDTCGGTEEAALATCMQSGFPGGEEIPEPQRVCWSSQKAAGQQEGQAIPAAIQGAARGQEPGTSAPA